MVSESCVLYAYMCTYKFRYLDTYWKDTTAAKKYAMQNLISKDVSVIIAENPILCFKMIWRFGNTLSKLHEMFKSLGTTGTK